MSRQKQLRYDFRIIKERIRRLSPHRLVKLGYIPADRWKYYYPGKGWDEKLHFQYLAVSTTEGFGVMHIPYFGDYLPQKWISDAWLSIHGASIVDIRKIGGKEIYNSKGLAGYFLRQYVAGQDALDRFSYSGGWVGSKGWVRAWSLALWKFMFIPAVKKWNLAMSLHDMSVLDEGEWYEYGCRG